MKMHVLGVNAAVVICLLVSPPARGEDSSGWKLPNLNPFSKKGAPPTAARISDDEGWKMPKLWPTSSATRAKSAAKSKSPSAWQKMTSGTSSFMSKTADAINPFDDAKDKEPVRVTGSRNAHRQASAKKNDKTGSWFPSLWGQEEEKRPKTVADFLNQPRPMP